MRTKLYILGYQISKYLTFRNKRKLRAASKTLLHNIAWTNDELNEWFLAAVCAQNSSHFVKFLLQNEAVDPAARDNLAIRMASRHGHSDVVALLLYNERVDPAAMDNK